MGISLSNRHSSIFVSFQNMSSYFAEICPKITIQTQRSRRRLDVRTTIVQIKKDNNIFKETVVSNSFMSEEESHGREISVVV